jgi:hypothetical protein
MYTAAEIQEQYLEATGNTERPKQTVAPDFAGYFKKAFAEIDNLFMQEVADGN